VNDAYEANLYSDEETKSDKNKKEPNVSDADVNDSARMVLKQ